jgi:phosphoglucosamine mutase
MISASHNPFQDNGIKVINGSGYKLENEVEKLIEDYIDGELPEIPLAFGENIGKTVDYSMGRHRYIGHLISLATRSFKGIKVGLDLANGSATTVAKGVFDALGAKTYVLHGEPNGVNINTECGSTHIEQLQKFVVEQGLDIGFAYDGDADRCLAVDELGQVIDGDAILYLCGCYMKERGELCNNTVVTTIMSNLGLYKSLDAKGIEYAKTAVGDKYVFENMMEHGHSIGGEQSGHIIFNKHATTGDGVLTSLKIMEVMLEKKEKISVLLRELKIYPQLLLNIRVVDKKMAKNDPDVIEAAKAVELELGDEGRILVRESGTEPVIRVMVEAGTNEVCQKYADKVVTVLRQKGHIKE